MPMIIDDLTIENSVTLQGSAVGTPVSLTPDLANAQGSATALARADHVHNIPTASAVGLDANTVNGQGAAATFARSNHTHAIATGVVSTQTPDQSNAAGSSANLSRADHVHNIPTASAIGLNANSTNAQGSNSSFARSDHSHAIATGNVSTQNADQVNASGSSTNLARADHIHNIPTATPVSTGTANAQGAAGTFAKSDHVHDTVIANYQATATADYAVAGAAVITGMTLTPPAGTYFATFSSSVLLNASGEGLDYGLYVGGALQAHTQRSTLVTDTFGTPTDEQAMHTQGIFTVNGSQAIDVRVITETGTATIHQRSLILIRLGP